MTSTYATQFHGNTKILMNLEKNAVFVSFPLPSTLLTTNMENILVALT